MTHDGKTCRCPHHSMMPIFITALGLIFLLGALDVLTARVTSIAWPIVVILAGLTKLTSKMCACCSAPNAKLGM